MLWLAIRFPYLPLEAAVEKSLLERSNVDANSPAQASERTSKQVVSEHNRVLQASAAASELGIKAGLKTSSARALCSDLHIFSRELSTEQDILQSLAQRLLFLSPTVCVTPPNVLLLEVGSCLNLFHGLENLFDVLRQSLNRTKHQWLYGFGHSPLCASILSTQPSDSSHYRSLSMDKAHFIQKLGSILIEDLPIEGAIRSSLQAPGFSTLADILALPRSELGKRQGVGLLDWLERLLGNKPDLRETITPPPRFYAEIEFPDPVETVSGLIFTAQRLLNELHYFLLQHQKSTRAIRWHFSDSKNNVSKIIIRRSSSNTDLNIWQDLTRRHFDQLILPAATSKIALDCARIQSNIQHSASMFDDPSQREDRKTLIDKLNALTRLQLSVIEEKDSHLPDDYQYESCPLPSQAPHKTRVPTNNGRRNNTPKRASFKNSPAQLRAPNSLFFDSPLWLLDQPQPLKQHNKTLCLRGKALEILPGENILKDGWWQKEMTRHYHVARHSDGMVCWIFYSPETNQWYLHGFF